MWGDENMTYFNNIERRVRMSRLVEKINKNESYSRKLGLMDVSQFHGKRIKEKENS